MLLPTHEIFQALSDPTRRRILELLRQNTHTIAELTTKFKMSRQAVSKHLDILNEARLINILEVGKERHCILLQDGFESIKHFLDTFQQYFETDHEQLSHILNKKASLINWLD